MCMQICLPLNIFMYVSANMNDFNLKLNARQFWPRTGPITGWHGIPTTETNNRRTSHRTKPRALHDFEEAAVTAVLYRHLKQRKH